MNTFYKLLLVLSFTLAIPCILFADKKPFVGWAERVKIYPGNFILHAKLDTGADHSSLSASNLTEFDKNGVKWVRFEVHNRLGQKATIERKVERYARIKKSAGKIQKRIVIRLTVCLGDRYLDVDVNLSDRSLFDFQMLIGRSFLAGNAIIDPASMYLVEPSCKEVS